MTSIQKSILLVAVAGIVGAAAYLMTGRTEQQTAENLPDSKDVVIEENTMKQLKSLGYTN